VPGTTVGNMTEEDPFGSPVDTLWHAEQFCDAGGTPIPALLLTNAAAYNQGNLGIYNYDTGGPNTGALVSPTFALGAGASTVSLSFSYIKETETGSIFDQSYVESRATGAGTWDVLTQLVNNQICGAGGTTATVSGGTGLGNLVTAGGGQLRLRLDTVDGVANTTMGWYVDNLALTTVTFGITPTYGAGCASSGGCTPVISTSGIPAVG